MGTFIGHLVPGLALAFLGLWHTINTIRVYHLKGSTKFMLRFWYPFNKLQYLELILILLFSIFAIIIQIFDFQNLSFSLKLDSLEHATIFLQLVIFSSFTLFSELNNHLSENNINLGVSGILVSSVFGMELFLLHYHSTDHVGLEGHYHWLMQLIVCVSFLAALSATSFPNSFHWPLILSMSVIFQGCWFINMGFMLWVPKFIPQGCVNSSKGAVLCEIHGGSDLRARALANLQFCWIFSAISILMLCACIAFGALIRRQSVEYEQLSLSKYSTVKTSMHGSVGTAVEFKQIQL